MKKIEKTVPEKNLKKRERSGGRLLHLDPFWTTLLRHHPFTIIITTIRERSQLLRLGFYKLYSYFHSEIEKQIIIHLIVAIYGNTMMISFYLIFEFGCYFSLMRE